jgi:hypothetical protein
MAPSMVCRRRASLLALVVVVASLSIGRAGAAPAPPSLPEEIPSAERARLMRVAEQASVSTQVDAEPFVSRPAIFEYLLDHPEFASHVTQALKLARYRIWHTPAGLFLDDGWGATGQFNVVYAAPGTRVMHAVGQYKPKAMPSIKGQAIVMLAYGFRPASGGGGDLVTSTVTGFVKLDSPVMAFASRLASSVAQNKADTEARRLMKVFARVSRAVQEDPAGVYERLRQRPETPQRELEEFRHLLDLR